MNRIVSWCPQCGPMPESDEDGCCASCGATIGEVPDAEWYRLQKDEAQEEALRLHRSLKEIKIRTQAIQAEAAAIIEKIARIDAS